MNASALLGPLGRLSIIQSVPLLLPRCAAPIETSAGLDGRCPDIQYRFRLAFREFRRMAPPHKKSVAETDLGVPQEQLNDLRRHYSRRPEDAPIDFSGELDLEELPRLSP